MRGVGIIPYGVALAYNLACQLWPVLLNGTTDNGTFLLEVKVKCSLRQKPFLALDVSYPVSGYVLSSLLTITLCEFLYL